MTWPVKKEIAVTPDDRGRRLSGDCLSNPRLWVECIVGATPEDEYIALIEGAGFMAPQVLGRLDYFCASTSVETRSIARSFNAGSIVLRAILASVVWFAFLRICFTFLKM